MRFLSTTVAGEVEVKLTMPAELECRYEVRKVESDVVIEFAVFQPKDTMEDHTKKEYPEEDGFCLLQSSDSSGDEETTQ